MQSVKEGGSNRGYICNSFMDSDRNILSQEEQQNGSQNHVILGKYGRYPMIADSVSNQQSKIVIK